MTTQEILQGVHDWTNGKIVYDISAAHPDGQGNPTPYADLTAALGTNGANIPETLRKGGMSIKFVQSSDNKYVQYRLMSDTFNTTVANWQGVDDEPTANSKNLIKSGGIYPILKDINTIATWKLETLLTPSKAIKLDSYNVGDAVSVKTVSNDSFCCGVFRITNSASILIRGYGGVAWRLYAFLDKDYKLISVAESSLVYIKPQRIEIPSSAYYIVVNINQTIPTTPPYLISETRSDWNENNTGSRSFILNKPIVKDTIYNVNKETNTIATIYTLETAIAAIPSSNRANRMIICFMSSVKEYKFYIYLIGSTSDSDFLNAANWFYFSKTNSDLENLVLPMQKIIDTFEYNGTLPSLMTQNKAINLGSYEIGQVVNTTPTTNNAINCGLFKASTWFKYVKVTGQGGVNPRLYGFLDKDKKLISMATGNEIQENAFIEIPNGTSYVVFNAYNTSEYSIRFELEVEKLVTNYPKAKWLAMGDSITEGYYSRVEDPGYARSPKLTWVHKMGLMKNITAVNRGIGGTGYAHGGNDCGRKLVDTLISSNAFDNIDLVTLAYGVNDWKYNENLGTMNDEVSSSATNIIPSMRYVIERISQNYPTIKIVVIMPINCSAFGSKANNYGIGHPFSNNGTLQDIYNAFVEVCEYYSIEYIDMLHSSVVNRENITQLLLDGVHPTPECHTMMARELAMKINCY